jgi:hypothetical protein
VIEVLRGLDIIKMWVSLQNETSIKDRAPFRMKNQLKISALQDEESIKDRAPFRMINKQNVGGISTRKIIK